MGRIRKFTEEIYTTLQEYANSSNYEWLWTYISWEIQDAFSDVDLTEETDGYQKYLQGIVEINDYTSEKLHSIYSNVGSIDRTYGDILSQVNEEVRDYTTIIKRLRESIVDVNFEGTFSKPVFLTSVATEAQTMMMVRWREILKKSADEITEEEYAILAAYLVKTGDEELLEEMLIACYDVREVAEYQNGGGLTTTRVIYESPKKIEELAKAMQNLSNVWTAAQSLDYTGEDQSGAFRAVQYTLLLQKLAQHEEISMLSQQGIWSKEGRTLLEDIIEVHYDTKTGAVTATLCPYNEKLSGSYCDYAVEKNQKMQYTVSYPAIGSSAWAEIQKESHSYINAALSGDRAPEAMTEEAIKQILGVVKGMIPGADEVTAVMDIVNAGVKAEVAAHDTTVQDSMALEDMGLMFDTFQLAYVGIDTNGEVKNHEYAIYGSEETANWIEAFNRYMQSEEGELATKLISYQELPEGKLTLEYLVNAPEEVAAMINEICDDRAYGPAFRQGMQDNYEKIDEGNDEK